MDFFVPTDFLNGVEETLTAQDFLNAASTPLLPCKLSGNFDNSIFDFLKQYGTLTTTTWNTAALMAKDPTRGVVKQDFLFDILKKSSIVGLQETHDDGFALEALLANSNFKVFNSINYNDRAAGASILINRNLIKYAISVTPVAIVEGWINGVDIAFPSFHIFYYNVHSNPNVSFHVRRAQIEELRSHLHAHRSLPTYRILSGDLNCDFAVEDRMTQTGQFTGKPDEITELFRAALHPLLEVFQADFTRRSPHASWSKLDRTFCDIPTGCGVAISSAIYHNDKYFRQNISDHFPLMTHFSVSKYTPVYHYPRHISATPEFKYYIDKVFPSTVQPDPWQALQFSSMVIREASQYALLNRVCDNPSRQELYHYVQKAIRFVVKNDEKSFLEVFAKCPLLKEKVPRCFSDPLLRDELVAFKFELSVLNDDEIENLSSDSVPDDEFKFPISKSFDSIFFKTNVLFQLIRQVKPNAGLTGIMVDDNVVSDPVSVHDLIAKYWSAGFSEKHVDDDAISELLRFCKTFPEANFLFSFEEFLEVIKKCRDSAPGPDSIFTPLGEICLYIFFVIFMTVIVYGLTATLCLLILMCRTCGFYPKVTLIMTLLIVVYAHFLRRVHSRVAILLQKFSLLRSTLLSTKFFRLGLSLSRPALKAAV